MLFRGLCVVVSCSLVVVCYALCGVGCWLSGVRCPLFVVCRLSFVVRCSVLLVCCRLCVVVCVLLCVAVFFFKKNLLLFPFCFLLLLFFVGVCFF